MVPRVLAIALVAIVALQAPGASAGPDAAEAFPPKRVLVFAAANGYRHVSIPAVVEAISALGRWASFTADVTESSSSFTDTNLARYDVVVFALTSGDVLDTRARAAFQRYIRGGGGYVGIHSAADTERSWPWYGRLVGAYTTGHTDVLKATVAVAVRDSTTDHLPPRWTREDEWYGYQPNPRTNGVKVLLTLDESTYEPGGSGMGGDHPIAWSHEFEGGRAWYTGGGGTIDSYTDPVFLEHVLDGLRWASNNGKAPRKSPRIVSVATGLKGQRVAVTVRFANCKPCDVRVNVRGTSTRLRAAGTHATGVTPPLPLGHSQLTLVIRDRTLELGAKTRRTVLVR